MNRRCPLPPVYALGAVVSIIALHFGWPLATLLARPWNWTGLLVLIVGTTMTVVGARLFSRRGTTIKPYEESTRLVTDGIFRVSRNPMYLGFTLMLTGLAMLLGTLTPYLAVLAFIVLINEVFIKMEERMLDETFGDEYVAYKQRTRRWI